MFLQFKPYSCNNFLSPFSSHFSAPPWFALFPSFFPLLFTSYKYLLTAAKSTVGVIWPSYAECILSIQINPLQLLKSFETGSQLSWCKWLQWQICTCVIQEQKVAHLVFVSEFSFHHFPIASSHKNCIFSICAREAREVCRLQLFLQSASRAWYLLLPCPCVITSWYWYFTKEQTLRHWTCFPENAYIMWIITTSSN